MEAAALCKAASVPVSSHLFVEASAHPLAATPGRHMLKWLNLAQPMLTARGPTLVDGHAVPCVAPGLGLEWNKVAVARLAA